MRGASRLVALAGLIIFLSGAILVSLAIAMPPRDVLKHEEETLLEDEPIIAPPRHYGIKMISWCGGPSGATVRGSIREAKGLTFDLYILDRTNFDSWMHGEPYKAYVEAKGVVRYDFEFSTKRSELFFVVKNRHELGVVEALLSVRLEYEKWETIGIPHNFITLGVCIAFSGSLASLASAVYAVRPRERKDQDVVTG